MPQLDVEFVEANWSAVAAQPEASNASASNNAVEWPAL
jgi:hypothetical protein